MASGSMLCGYGRTSFRQIKDDTEAKDVELDIMFAPEKSDDLVMIETSLTTFGAVVTSYAEEKTKEAAKIQYHEIVPVPGNDTIFTLKKLVDIACRPKPTGTQGPATPSNFAVFAPLKVWDTAFSKTVWVCKWSANGLMPIRALVIITSPIEIPPNSAIAF